MKLWCLIFILGSGMVNFAQSGEVIHTLDTFTEVKVFDGISVTLVKSNQNSAVIRGENSTEVELVNNQGLLKVRMNFKKVFSGYKTFITLNYTEELLVLDVNEDALLESEEPFNQSILEVKAQEGGEIKIHGTIEQLLVKSVTGGVVNANGVGNVQDIQINTGGIYYGKEFRSKFTTINVNAGSQAHIFATDYVKSTVKAGGEVIIYGDPEKLEKKTVFGGTIKKM